MTARALALSLTALALALRLWNVDFGLPGLNDPDELIFELGAVKLLSKATLNPAWFGHPGTTTIYLLALIDISVFGLGWLAGWFASPAAFADAIYADPTWVILPGRIAMAAFGAGCVWQVWRLGARLAGPVAGLTVAALLAVDPVHVTWSQVIRTDIMASFFLLASLRACVRVATRGRARDTVWAAAWLGLAIATKWPFAIGLLGLAGAQAWRWRTGHARLGGATIAVARGAALTLIFLLLASPYLLLDWPTVVDNLRGEAQVQHLGATGGGVGFNLAYYAQGPVLTGLGALGAVLAVLGLARAIWRRDLTAAVVLPVAAGFTIAFATQTLVWERWALPLLPLLGVFAGIGVRWLSDQRHHAVAGALIGAAMLHPAWTMAGRTIERGDDTRQRAAAWARAHLPADSTVVIEHFAFDLIAQPWRFLFPLGEAGCVDARALLGGKVVYAPVDAARGGRSNLDYGTLPAARAASCAADYAIITQADRYAAEAARFPVEHARYAALDRDATLVAAFRPAPRRTGGPVVRIYRLR